MVGEGESPQSGHLCLAPERRHSRCTGGIDQSMDRT
jgi:hypothetical protein